MQISTQGLVGGSRASSSGELLRLSGLFNFFPGCSTFLPGKEAHERATRRGLVEGETAQAPTQGRAARERQPGRGLHVEDAQLRLHFAAAALCV